MEKKLGRNQKMGLAVMVGPFLVASAALFTSRADFAEWSSFCQVFLPMTLGTVLGLGALVKVKVSKAEQ